MRSFKWELSFPSMQRPFGLIISLKILIKAPFWPTAFRILTVQGCTKRLFPGCCNPTNLSFFTPWWLYLLLLLIFFEYDMTCILLTMFPTIGSTNWRRAWSSGIADGEDVGDALGHPGPNPSSVSVSFKSEPAIAFQNLWHFILFHFNKTHLYCYRIKSLVAAWSGVASGATTVPKSNLKHLSKNWYYLGYSKNSYM